MNTNEKAAFEMREACAKHVDAMRIANDHLIAETVLAQRVQNMVSALLMELATGIRTIPLTGAARARRDTTTERVPFSSASAADPGQQDCPDRASGGKPEGP